MVNTSFNVRNEPIVCSPTDAFRCFMATNLDLLIVNDFVLFKEDQDRNLVIKYFELYEND